MEPKRSYRHWWEDKLVEYPYVTGAPLSKIRPPRVQVTEFGQFISVGSSVPGIRLYGFKTADAAARFAEKFGVEVELP